MIFPKSNKFHDLPNYILTQNSDHSIRQGEKNLISDLIIKAFQSEPFFFHNENQEEHEICLISEKVKIILNQVLISV